MKTQRFKTYRDVISLRSLLHRTQLVSALFVVALTSVVIVTTSMFTIVRYANHSLSLLGRTVAYNIEAAIIFNDREALADSLGYMAKNEEIAEALVFDHEDTLLAHWRDADIDWYKYTSRKLADTLLNQPFSQVIEKDGYPIGRLELSINGAMLMSLVFNTLLMLMVCLLFSLWRIYAAVREIRGQIVVPLATLSEASRNIARERDFKQRVPGSRIRELNYLAEDFNSLLEEIQDWHSHIQNENASLSHKAQHDALTGLLNRSQFEPVLHAAMKNADRGNCSCALLFVDCDRFKEINDSLGHMVGDAVLLEVAERLTSNLRKSDVVIRLGGDEFAVLLYPVHDQSDALKVADKVLASMQTAIKRPAISEELLISVSIGIAMYPEHARTDKELLQAADAAMYRAKRSKSGKYLAGS